MKYIIFYSWQSSHQDTRNYLDKFIRETIQELNAKYQSSPVEIVLDQDTADSAGSPHITRILHNKIQKCNLLLADISLVGQSLSGNRSFPNPNVMYEVGFATATHSENSVLLVFNQDLGKMEELPFDIAQRKVNGFSIANDSSGTNFCKTLAKQIELCIEQFIKTTENEAKNTPSYHIGNDLDDIEEKIMRMMSKINDNFELDALTSLDGTTLIANGKAQKDADTLCKHYSINEILANIDDLIRKDYLRETRYANGADRRYTPTKKGYDLFRAWRSN
ncbi:hypothetical protein IJ114_02315 [Candidatus Saccharibacteria bacterium]|nr:hypothetical protein [Candidatus Saccharibacteria bacterium]